MYFAVLLCIEHCFRKSNLALYIYMMFVHENHALKLWVETKFEVCDSYSFLTLVTW